MKHLIHKSRSRKSVDYKACHFTCVVFFNNFWRLCVLGPRNTLALPDWISGIWKYSTGCQKAAALFIT